MSSDTNIIDSLKWRYACKKFDASKKLSSDQVAILKHSFNFNRYFLWASTAQNACD